MSALLFNKKEYFCGEFGTTLYEYWHQRNFAFKKEKNISEKEGKRGKKEFFFSYLPHGLCRTPRYTEEHCFLVFVLVDPPCWAVLPPPPSKEEGSSLAFCFKKKTKTKKKWGLLEEESIRKSAGKKRLLQKGTPPPLLRDKKKLFEFSSRVAVINARTKQRSASKTLRSARKL